MDASRNDRPAKPPATAPEPRSQETPDEKPLALQILTSGQTASAHLAMAVALFQSGHYQRADVELDAALRANPELAQAHFIRAMIQIARGDFTRSAEHLQYAVRLGEGDDKEADYWTALAFVLRELGNLDAALAAIDKALTLDPKNAKIHQERGELLLQMKQPTLAAEAFQETLRLNPLLTQPRFRLARILQEQGRDEESLQQTLRGLQLNPTNIHAHRTLGNLLRRTGKHQEALKEYGLAMELAPQAQMGQFWTDMGETHLEIGQAREAILCLRKAVELSPKQTRCYYLLGRVYLDGGQPELALELMETALRLDLPLAEANVILEEAKKALGR